MNDKNKILIVGSGGREHGIALALNKYSKHKIDYIGENNAFLNSIANRIGSYDKCWHAIVPNKKYYKYAIVGPEKPLSDGFVDTLENIGIPVIGPNKLFAQIGISKIFCRNLLSQTHLDIYQPSFIAFDKNDDNLIKNLVDLTLRKQTFNEKQYDLLYKFIHSCNNNFVIKNDEKFDKNNVLIYGEDFNTDTEGIHIVNKLYNKYGKILLEEKLDGVEFSLMSFVSNGHLSHMPIIKNYKRAYDNDNGPNTGGMGSINNPQLLYNITDEDINTTHYINEEVIKLLEEKYNTTINKKYCGILHGSYIKTDRGIKLLRFSPRFGNPECLNIFKILKTSLHSIFLSMLSSNLQDITIEYDNIITVCKYLVPKGYPEKPLKNYDIYCNENMDENDRNNLISASIIEKKINGEKHYMLGGSRAIAFVGSGKSHYDASINCDNVLKQIYGPMWFRKDIAYNKYNGYDEIINNGCNGYDEIINNNEIVNNIVETIEKLYDEDIYNIDKSFSKIFKIDDYYFFTSINYIGMKSSFLLTKMDNNKASYILGTDIVNRCFNDNLIYGGHPMFFLDYFTSSYIDNKYLPSFIKAITDASKKHNSIMLGKDNISNNKNISSIGNIGSIGSISNHKNYIYDIIGAAISKSTTVINSIKNISEGDYFIALPSNGPHTNGYGLLYDIIKNNDTEISDDILQVLMNNHKSYYSEFTIFNDNFNISGMVHISDGGLCNSIKKAMPNGLGITINKNRLMKTHGFENVCNAFQWIQNTTGIPDYKLSKIFNCGIGYIIFIKSIQIDFNDIINFCKEKNINAYLGKVEKNKNHLIYM